MREVVFSIYHHDCWGPRVSSKFPEHSMEMLSFPILLRQSDATNIYSILWRFDATNAASLDAMLRYASDVKQMNELRIIEKSGPSAIVCLTVKSNGWVLDRVLESNCHQIGPLRVSGGKEHWHVVTEDVGGVKRLLSSLEEIGEVKAHRIGRYSPSKRTGDLTAKQEDAFSIAIRNGYYSWPRHCSLEELAKFAKISRKVYQEHLRKAEVKLMQKIAKDVVGES